MASTIERKHSTLSLPELKAIRVKCRSSFNSDGVVSVVTNNMTVTDLKKMLLRRSMIKGVDPAAFCVVAHRHTSETSDVGIETDLLEDTDHPFGDKALVLKNSRFSIRQRHGKVVEVYDGRKWPVVRCGSVYITPSDNPHKVTQTVLAAPNVQEKKRRAVKYTVAVGTTHGHVQVFLKDTDIVLSAFDQCPAEEKCLMLIKKPKDASRKLLKAQSINNLSMSDTQLYRQYDGTAYNNPYTAHKMKAKSPPGTEDTPMVSEIYNTEPRVRKSGGQANATHSGKSQASRLNAFVPIPELGIFTPEQHVLQNGTYAQHCHLRELNNNKKNGAENHLRHSLADNSSSTITNLNSSFNSSMDESVNSCGFQNKGVLTGFNSGYGQSRYPANDVYHSCMDISNVNRDDRDFNTISSSRSHEPEHRRVREGVPTISNKPIREEEKEENVKMDPGARSHSLGDLSTGLTFSLVGQKKSDSVMSVDETNSKGYEGLKSPGRESDSSGNSALKHIRERLQKAVLNSQSRRPAPAAPKNGSGFKTVLEEAPSQSSQRKPGSDTYPHQQNYSHHRREPHYRIPDQQQHYPQQHQQRVSNFQKQHSASEEPSQQYQLLASPRRRVESDESTSSYRRQSVESKPSHDATSYNYTQPGAISNNNNNNNQTNSSHSLSTLNNSNALTSSHSSSNNSNNNNSHSNPHPIREKVSNKNSTNNNNNNNTSGHNRAPVSNPHSHSTPQPSREQSPTKPKRSLPNVPLSETSERIKRFTEIMKSRISNSSNGSRNYSADSINSNKGTPSRMSSVDSVCSQNSLSRKSSIETASDCEVFTITNNTNQRRSEKSQPYGNGNGTVREPYNTTSQVNNSQDNRGNNGYYISKPAGNDATSKRQADYVNQNFHVGNSGYGLSGHRRINSGNGSDLQNSNSGDLGTHHGNQSQRGGNQGYNGHEGQGHGSYSGQGQRTLSSEETPLPPGDRSSDSGQTAGTNHSYNGSALDSGYTTNNDGENDSFNTQPQHHQYHNNQHQQQYNHQQQHQSYHNHQATPKQHTRQPQPKTTQSPPKVRADLPKFSDQRFHDYYRPTMKYSNLANAHRFGSVQNVSTAQAHGNPRDGQLTHENSVHSTQRKNPLPYQHRDYTGSNSAREPQTHHNSQNGSFRPVPIKSELLPVTHQLSHAQDSSKFKPANRRSWDYSDGNFVNDDGGFGEYRMKKYGRNDERYRSNEVISHSRGQSDGNYVNTNQFYAAERNNIYAVLSSKKQPDSDYRQTGTKKETHLNHANGLPPQMTQSYNGDLNTDRTYITQPYKSQTFDSTQNDRLPSDKVYGNNYDRKQNGFHPPNSAEEWNTEFYRRENAGNQQQPNSPPEGVRPRPVPVSRALRHARGRTLPGGFRFNETEQGVPQSGNHEITLFHMAQSYDFAPLLLNLPTHTCLKDLVQLKEFTMEISLVGVPGTPSTPQGHTPKIGSPGSAFTPVKNASDQDTPLTASIKVVCFCNAWEEVHKHTTLGRVLEGDILVEVNGWFCLGADVVYMQRIVENCQGAITLTVARIKESDEKRFKGQTPAERVKGLEAEISRLDDLIMAREEKIRDLTAGGSGTSSVASRTVTSMTSKTNQGTPVLCNVNGQIPVEGMVIGDDEYVV